jgi:2-iminobutanoate/2-iminopropanoate deaminase
MTIYGFRSALAPAPDGPASAAVSAGRLVFVSAQLPGDACGAAGSDAAGDSTAGQARRAFDHLAHQLRATGLGLDTVAALTIHLVDPADLEAVDEVCRACFTEPYPARTVAGATWLPGGARLQVAAVAVRY